LYFIKKKVMSRCKKVHLSAASKSTLKKLLHSGEHSSRKLNRARLLLKLEEGQSPSKIADQLAITRTTVYNVLNRFQEEGLESALEERPRSGTPPRIDGPSKAAITSLACSSPPDGHSQWSLRLLSEKAVELGLVEEISYRTVGRILKKTS